MESIIYSGWLEEDSYHSISRAKERAGLNRKKALKMMDLAKTRGITSKDCNRSADRAFLESKSSVEKETVAMAFNGYCFIFDEPTMNCITMFRLPKHFGQKRCYRKEEPRRNWMYEVAYA